MINGTISTSLVPINNAIRSLVPCLIAQPSPKIKCIIIPSTKNAMQSGCYSRHRWLISFVRNSSPRWTNQIIGWTSSRDAMQAVKLGFDTREKAELFAKSNGWEIGKIQDEPIKKWHLKSYSENFKYSESSLKLIGTK